MGTPLVPEYMPRYIPYTYMDTLGKESQHDGHGSDWEHDLLFICESGRVRSGDSPLQSKSVAQHRPTNKPEKRTVSYERRKDGQGGQSAATTCQEKKTAFPPLPDHVDICTLWTLGTISGTASGE